MKKILLFLFLVTFQNYAQDETKPWALGVGLNTTDASQYSFSSFGDQIKDYFAPFNDSNTFLGKVYVARYLNKSFTLDFVFSYNSLQKKFTNENELDNLSYLAGDLGLRYDLNNVIGNTGWFDPYIKGGIGGVLVDGNDGAIPLIAGFGFNTWFNDQFGLNFETNYKNSAYLIELGLENLGDLSTIGSYHFHHSISLVYKFGMKDADNDGVSDKDDLCPQDPGSKENYGCPDSDGDGIVDKDDMCPNLSGSSTANGCPDSDEDSVLDDEDECPEIKGIKELNGCPDSDGDGIADKDDECPNMSGHITAKGCPDSDGDGVADYEDECPKIAGTKELGGCSEPERLSMNDPNAILSKGELVKTIYFKFASVAINYEDQKKLDEVVKMLDDETMIAGFYVEGHTDSIGTEAVNLRISKKRADSVVEYLVSEGVDESRLLIYGYGEAQPVTTNATREGRSKNRRVEITVVVVKK